MTADGPAAAPSPARSLVVVSAGLSVPSSTRLLADRLAAATERHLRDAGAAAVQVVELREHAQDLVNHLLTGFPSPKLQAAIDAVVGADGLIAVSPIFNASYSGLFKLFFDVVEQDGLAGKPTLLAATGGTARHSLAIDHAMRPALRLPERGRRRDRRLRRGRGLGRGRVDADGGLVERIDRAAAELAAAMAARARAAAPDPFLDPVPFEELLGSPPPAV